MWPFSRWFYLVPRRDTPGYLVTDEYETAVGEEPFHIAEGKAQIIRQLKALGCVEKHLDNTAIHSALWTPGEDEENSGEFEDTSGGYFLLGRYRSNTSETFYIPTFDYIKGMNSYPGGGII